MHVLGIELQCISDVFSIGRYTVQSQKHRTAYAAVLAVGTMICLMFASVMISQSGVNMS
jgi:hypothetical protein